MIRHEWYWRLWYWIISPYEEWKHKTFMEGWNAGYSDCEDHIERSRDEKSS